MIFSVVLIAFLHVIRAEQVCTAIFSGDAFRKGTNGAESIILEHAFNPATTSKLYTDKLYVVLELSQTFNVATKIDVVMVNDQEEEYRHTLTVDTVDRAADFNFALDQFKLGTQPAMAPFTMKLIRIVVALPSINANDQLSLKEVRWCGDNTFVFSDDRLTAPQTNAFRIDSNVLRSKSGAPGAPLDEPVMFGFIVKSSLEAAVLNVTHDFIGVNDPYLNEGESLNLNFRGKSFDFVGVSLNKLANIKFDYTTLTNGEDTRTQMLKNTLFDPPIRLTTLNIGVVGNVGGLALIELLFAPVDDTTTSIVVGGTTVGADASVTSKAAATSTVALQQTTSRQTTALEFLETTTGLIVVIASGVVCCLLIVGVICCCLVRSGKKHGAESWKEAVQLSVRNPSAVFDSSDQTYGFIPGDQKDDAETTYGFVPGDKDRAASNASEYQDIVLPTPASSTQQDYAGGAGIYAGASGVAAEEDETRYAMIPGGERPKY